MKISIVALFTLLIASAAAAQGLPSSSLTRGTWELGVFAGGGDGLGKSDNTQFLVAGGRGGLVLTGEHLPGILRGNFEWAVEVIPVYIVFPPNRGIYGGSVKPFLWEWNFTHFQKVSPFFGVAGGALFTRANIPPGDTYRQLHAADRSRLSPLHAPKPRDDVRNGHRPSLQRQHRQPKPRLQRLGFLHPGLCLVQDPQVARCFVLSEPGCYKIIQPS